MFGLKIDHEDPDAVDEVENYMSFYFKTAAAVAVPLWTAGLCGLIKATRDQFGEGSVEVEEITSFTEEIREEIRNAIPELVVDNGAGVGCLLDVDASEPWEEPDSVL